MSHSDELRILAEMQTFTQKEFAAAAECSTQWACQVFEQLVRERVIERVRVGRQWLYALTARGKARVAKMPAIDPGERCLLLVRVNITQRYLYHNDTPVLDTSEDELPVISEYCRVCGEEFFNLPVTGRCADCDRLWHS